MSALQLHQQLRQRAGELLASKEYVVIDTFLDPTEERDCELFI